MKDILTAPFVQEMMQTTANMYRLGWDERISLVLVDIEHTILVVGTKEVGHQFHHLTYL